MLVNSFGSDFFAWLSQAKSYPQEKAIVVAKNGVELFESHENGRVIGTKSLYEFDNL